MVSAFAAIYSPLEATARACFLAGEAGKCAVQKAGNELSLIPLDLIDAQAEIFARYSK
jgi:NAD(P)H-hydrate repair Nnr-like enzyme with NAD(P)H-hydrate dehydratase domain